MTATPSRRRATIVIASFLALMVLTPLSYYTVRSSPYDERFAWRMFSSIRMIRCRVDIAVGDQPLSLGSSFHEAWIGLAQRGRDSVLRGMGAHLCEQNPGKPVRIKQVCRKVDGKIDVVRDGSRDVCTEET